MAESGNVVVSISPKTIGIVLALLICSITSALILSQTLFNNGSNVELQEYLDLSNQHVWGNQSGWTQASIVLVNTGEKDATLKKVVVHSAECDWNDVYCWKTQTGPISSELEITPTQLVGAAVEITVDGTRRAFQQAYSGLTLPKSWTIVLYVRDPIDSTLTDIPAEVIISIFTESKVYYKQAPVDITFTFKKTEELKITHVYFPTTSRVEIYVTNTGVATLTITKAYIDNVERTIAGCSFDSSSPYDLSKGATGYFNVTFAWTSGVKYTFALLTASGNKYEYATTAVP